MFLIDFSLGKVEGVVREELTDDSGVKAELLELQLLVELGDIDDDEYIRREAALMARLREIRDWRERFGMGVSGGAVRVAGSAQRDEDAAARAGADDAARAVGEQRVPAVAKPTGVEIEFHIDGDDNAA